MADEIKWVVPDAEDAESFLEEAVLAALKDNGDDDQAGGRLTKHLAMQVARVRGAVNNARRQALSATAGTVPPEAEAHVWTLAVQAMAAAVAGVAKYVADNEAWRDQVKAAQAWLDKVNSGDYTVTNADNKDESFQVSATWGDYTGKNEDGEAGKLDLSLDNT